MITLYCTSEIPFRGSMAALPNFTSMNARRKRQRRGGEWNRTLMRLHAHPLARSSWRLHRRRKLSQKALDAGCIKDEDAMIETSKLGYKLHCYLQKNPPVKAAKV